MPANSTFIPLALRDFANQEQYIPLSPYDYLPTFGVCVTFLALFGLSTIIHTIQSILSRNWYLLGTVVFAGMIECLGWSARLWSSLNLRLDTPFTIQITATIIAPTPFLASNFVILSRIIANLGPQYSRLSPKLYTAIFVTSDIIALVLQGAGGGIASTAHEEKMLDLGSNIMLGGIAFQLAIMTIFAALALEFFFRYMRDTPFHKHGVPHSPVASEKAVSRTIIMSYALGFTTVCLWIRAVYRVLELSEGWNGRIITTEIYFNVLDGGMVILAFVAYNIVHPGIFLPRATPISHSNSQETVFGNSSTVSTEPKILSSQSSGV